MKKISKSFLAAGICTGLLLIGSLTICAVKHTSIHSITDVIINGEVGGVTVDNVTKNGPMKEVKYKVSTNTSAINASSAVKIVYTQVNNPSEVGVTAQIPQDLVKFFDVTQRGNGISIGLSKEGNTQKRIRINEKSTPVFYVSTLSLNTVNLEGASDLDVKGTLITRGQELRWNASGSSEINIGFLNANKGKATFMLSGASELEIKQTVAENLTIQASGASDAEISNANLKSVILQVSGSSDIEIDGRAEIASFGASGASEIDAKKLDVKSASANASGSSEIKCNVKELSESSSGNSSIKNQR